MPEGDTVFRSARLLDRALSGHELVGSDFRVPELATVDLRGATVERTRSRGKHLLTRLVDVDGGRWTLHTHLKMEGAWRIIEDGERWRRPAHQARVVLTVPRRQAVGFSLGIVELLPTAEEEALLGYLGPDLLGPDWSEEIALARLTADPAIPLHQALLDQRNLAGIGNMYAAELCFISGYHPRQPVGEVDRLARLVRRARQMLDLNKERAIQATTGDLREPHWVYRRDGRACRRCGATIEVDMAGPSGRERAIYWCPACQPVPTDAT
ncbi:DNA-formamidopyrimidine glycosylase family protein [Nocardioides sp. R-C-SC26]|uniref:DNA-formamidopyrimidine glycosylase family protein n=1 Tax=Nocardioides sp. R-C-SC26 TaxID=2870414 RepID=UPI001E507275|nr:DNA-formamidopyrimidine glycosylase family protein [Nocardioides sp. R-C-SC26]